MDIQEKDPLEIYVEGDNIILRKYHEACVFCGSVRHIVSFGGRYVCPECVEKLNRMIK